MHQGKIVGIAEEGSRTGSETDRQSREWADLEEGEAKARADIEQG